MSHSRNIAGVVLLVALALGLGATATPARERNALASSSILTVVDGVVLIGHDGSDFSAAHEGDVIAAGDTIRTEVGAAAEITYVEGSTGRIEADTQIVVASLPTSNNGVIQTLGRSWLVVTRLISGGSRFEVRTPSSTASVRG